MELNTQPPYQFSEGACLLFDKDLNWTSFQLVKKVKYLTKAKTGHAGTLDPLATGLLIVCTGKMTKQINQIQGLDKVYTGSIKLGATTASYDAESPEEKSEDISHLTEDQIRATAQEFLGDQLQVPPMFSSLKKNGKKLYELAREGVTIDRPPRPIHIFQFDITNIELPFVSFEIKCSKGTYIRSIAHDFGQKLAVGGYLSALRRTAIGQYSIDQAWTIADFEQYISSIAHADL